MEDDTLPSKLRTHIKAEKLRPDKSLFDRSLVSIYWFIAIPYILVLTVVVISSLKIFSPILLLIVSFPLLLAAQRCSQTLIHDLSHRLFSQNIQRNDLLGNYLIGGWIGASVGAYRKIHVKHHKYNGSSKDPEHISFEIIRQRGGLLLHCLRYIAGLEALRLVNKYYGKVSNSTDNSGLTASTRARTAISHILLCQFLLACIFYFVADAWYLYGLWLYLAVSWNPMLSNLRFLVEHPGESGLTVSTSGNFLERLYFAPYNFNYHLEHHLWPNIPPYHLATVHGYLREQGYFERHPEFLGSSYVKSLWRRK
jgi:fatty acid desaturase